MIQEQSAGSPNPPGKGRIALLEDIQHFYSGRDHQRYCDICVFHCDDRDLAEVIRRCELEFFNRLRD